MKNINSLCLAVVLCLSLFCSPIRADIKIYRQYGYKNISSSFIVQFPFINGFVRYLYISSFDLLPDLLKFVTDCYEGNDHIDDMVTLERDLATSVVPHPQLVEDVRVWLFDFCR